MYPLARRGSFPKHLHVLGDDQGRQDIADPVYQVRSDPLRVIALQEALESTVTDGSGNHLLQSTV